jgi:hypothetical protein
VVFHCTRKFLKFPEIPRYGVKYCELCWRELHFDLSLTNSCATWTLTCRKALAWDYHMHTHVSKQMHEPADLCPPRPTVRREVCGRNETRRGSLFYYNLIRVSRFLTWPSMPGFWEIPCNAMDSLAERSEVTFLVPVT